MASMRGQAALTAPIRDVIDSLTRAAVPLVWAVVSRTVDVPGQSLGQWMDLLRLQESQLRQWFETTAPPVFWLPGFINPKVRVYSVQCHW